MLFPSLNWQLATVEAFDSLDDAFRQQLERVMASGAIVSPKAEHTIEAGDTAFRISNPLSRLITTPKRHWSLPYAFGETLWHLSGSRSLNFIAYYSKRWNRFSAGSDTIRGSCYGHRIFVQEVGGSTRWLLAKQLLQHDPDTRRCVITMYQPNDLAHAKDAKDLPCCNLLQFFIREGRLCLVCYMRSNDLMYGFGYDIFLFSFLQELMAFELGLPLGWYQHVVGSLHIYGNDMQWASEIIADNTPPGSGTMHPMVNPDELSAVLEYERMIRTGHLVRPDMQFEVTQYWSDILTVLLVHRITKEGDPSMVDEASIRLQNTAYAAFIHTSKGLEGYRGSYAPR